MTEWLQSKIEYLNSNARKPFSTKCGTRCQERTFSHIDITNFHRIYSIVNFIFPERILKGQIENEWNDKTIKDLQRLYMFFAIYQYLTMYRVAFYPVENCNEEMCGFLFKIVLIFILGFSRYKLLSKKENWGESINCWDLTIPIFSILLHFYYFYIRL